MANIQPYLDDIMSAVYGEEVRGSIHDAIEAINNECEEGVSATSGSAKLAESWAIGGTGTRTGENTNNAKYYAQQAASSASSAASSVTAQLQEYVTQAAGSATSASQQAQAAASSAQAAEGYAQDAKESAEEAAQDVVDQLQDYADAAAASALLAESWAVGDTDSRTGENSNNAKYWANIAKSYADSFSGGVTFIASIPFANLPATGMNPGWMYNITDAFVTTSAFQEGAGIKAPAGTNIIYNTNNKWDLLAAPGDAAHVPATDTHGISAAAGTVTTAQELLDAMGAVLDTSVYTYKILATTGEYIRTTEGGAILGTDAFVKLSAMNKIIRDLKQYMADNYVTK